MHAAEGILTLPRFFNAPNRNRGIGEVDVAPKPQRRPAGLSGSVSRAGQRGAGAGRFDV
jgi:hypothetical protein